MADSKKDDKPATVDPTTTTSPQPSIDPVYQAGKTVGGSDPSPVRAYGTTRTTDLRGVIGGSQDANTARRGFIGYPKTLYHPTLGARTIEDPNGEAELPGPQHNWWPTPGEADMHRTDLEAQEAIHQARRWKNDVNVAMINDEPVPVDTPDLDKDGTPINTETNLPVRLSVQAEENLKTGGIEPH